MPKISRKLCEFYPIESLGDLELRIELDSAERRVNRFWYITIHVAGKLDLPDGRVLHINEAVKLRPEQVGRKPMPKRKPRR